MDRKMWMDTIIALTIGALWGMVCYSFSVSTGRAYGDFYWAIDSARHLLAGTDPYAFEPSALLVPYPLPVALFGLPLVWLSSPSLIAAIFIGASSAVLAFGILRRGCRWQLLLFLTPAYYHAVIYVQWSPLIVAAWFYPILAPLLVTVKPHTALPVALNRLTVPGVAVAGVVLLASLVIYPLWPLRWLSMIGDYQRIFAVAYLPLGPLLLLAALRWQDEKARLLLAMAVLPLRGLYDLTALYLVPASGRQMAVLVALSWLPFASSTFFVVPFAAALMLILWQGRREIITSPPQWWRRSHPQT